MPFEVEMSPAVTTPGPVARISSRFGPSTSIFTATPLRFRTMSVTSSRTPGTDENSCSTPSICTRGDRRALQRGEQHAPERVAERQAEAALERLGDGGGLAVTDRRRP